MWFLMVVMVPVLLPTLVIKTISCSNASSSEVFFKYSGHVEANAFSPEPRVVFSSPETTVRPAPSPVPTNPPTVFHHPVTSSRPPTTQPPVEEDTESVVFIPNASPVVRIGDEEAEKNGYKLNELLDRTRVNDVMDKHFRVETESPDQVVFVAQKNQDDIEERMKEERKEKRKRRKETDGTTSISELDCTNLDCNNTIKSICGVKLLDRQWRYRLFLNECYFRKVNCNFKYVSSRYAEVPIERCDKIGGHVEERPFSFKPRYYENTKDKANIIARRSFSSRRSMAMNVEGDFCSHPCPVSCPDDYEPECAVSATGQKKVFMNHCKLDDNSCLFAVVWHKRPLSECVGGHKADIRQNRFFIGWMQRVGILDSKGKLVLE